MSILLFPNRNNICRHDMIACLGETTGTDALNRILAQMKNCNEGQRILKEKPRINSNDIDLEALGKLPDNTFGFHYKQFLDDNVSFTVSQIIDLISEYNFK